MTDARHLALLSHRLRGAGTLDEVHRLAADAARDLLHGETVACWRLHHDGRTLLAALPRPAVAPDPMVDPAGARRSTDPLTGLRHDPTTRLSQLPVPTLTTPVLVNGEVWGALVVTRGDGLGPDDTARAEVVAALVGAHVARLDLAEQVRHLVSDDPLTGLSTRRVADEAAQDALASGEETCVAMCDVDGLERVNADLDHDVGDDLLRSVAGVLRRAGEDLPGATVARLGGDEFCLVTRGLPRNQVVAVVGAAVRSARLPHGATLSYGVASSATGALGAQQTVRSLFRRADAAQYHAKRSHAAARPRHLPSGDPAAVLGRAVSAGVGALAGTGSATLPRLCALAAAVTQALGGSSWAVRRDLPGGPVVVAQGGASTRQVPGVHGVQVGTGGWFLTLETTLPEHDRAVDATLHTLVSLAVGGAL